MTLRAVIFVQIFFRRDATIVVAWGRSECLDPDDVGDIADEGMGHRG